MAIFSARIGSGLDVNGLIYQLMAAEGVQPDTDQHVVRATRTLCAMNSFSRKKWLPDPQVSGPGAD